MVPDPDQEAAVKPVSSMGLATGFMDDLSKFIPAYFFFTVGFKNHFT